MKRFKPFGVVLAAVFAIAFACFAQALPTVSTQHPVMRAASAVHAAVAVAQMFVAADVRHDALLPTTKTIDTSTHEPVMYKRHYQAVTRLALYVEDVPIVRRS